MPKLLQCVEEQTKRIKLLTLSLCKTPLGETGCLGNPYFYLLVA